jgi:hypothetical protein
VFGKSIHRCISSSAGEAMTASILRVPPDRAARTSVGGTATTTGRYLFQAAWRLIPSASPTSAHVAPNSRALATCLRVASSRSVARRRQDSSDRARPPGCLPCGRLSTPPNLSQALCREMLSASPMLAQLSLRKRQDATRRSRSRASVEPVSRLRSRCVRACRRSRTVALIFTLSTYPDKPQCGTASDLHKCAVQCVSGAAESWSTRGRRCEVICCEA